MSQLSKMKNTVMQVADAITAALDIETEIVDDKLMIIGGTGRYVKKIGSFEESGDLSSDYLYADILRSGYEYVCLDARRDRFYDQVEGELAEITCPIQIENKIIGIIGLVAFTKGQKEKITNKKGTYLNFLRRMSELIAGKVVESQSNNKLASLLDNMPEGLLASDLDGRIFACNFSGETMLHQQRDQLIGSQIDVLFPAERFFIDTSETVSEKEIIYKKSGERERMLFSKVPIPGTGIMYIFRDAVSEAAKAQQFLHVATTFSDISGTSQCIEDVRQRARQAAFGDSTVLITGESGTGKELFARSIHNASHRSSNAFVPVNCGAIPDALLESELFGYEKGAFTGASASGKIGKFELANHGTIFLDEVGDMPLHLQVKLLSVLQNRTIDRVGGTAPIDIDIRVIAATNKDLDTMVRKGEFREDLYFRLNVIPIPIPPLRDRKEDIEELLERSLSRFSDLLGKEIRSFDKAALKLLTSYTWPGNIRELENTVEYSVNMSSGNVIETKDLPPRIKDGRQADPSAGGTLQEQIDSARRRIISSTLDRTGKNLAGKRRAADLLGISESTLYRKMRELGIK
ncbi:MAG: sigma 54-interacting transcriptional regulator [Eubacteriaceae bacterium]|nr:sigma 54-interacting transcriptional regulator [Eubacteriaceae bacterium]